MRWRGAKTFMQNRSRIRKRATQTPPSVSVHSKTEFEKFPFLIAFLFPKYSTVDPFSSPDKNGVLKMLLWRFSVDLLMGCLLKVSSWRPFSEAERWCEEICFWGQTGDRVRRSKRLEGIPVGLVVRSSPLIHFIVTWPWETPIPPDLVMRPPPLRWDSVLAVPRLHPLRTIPCSCDTAGARTVRTPFWRLPLCVRSPDEDSCQKFVPFVAVRVWSLCSGLWCCCSWRKLWTVYLHRLWKLGLWNKISRLQVRKRFRRSYYLTSELKAW